MNVVALYEFDGGLANVCCRKGSSFYDSKMQQCKEYEELGAKLVSCIITNNEEVFYKARLKAMLTELRHTVRDNAEWLADVKQHCPQEVIDQTKRIIEEIEETLVEKVAIRCSSLLLRDIPIEDELAIACYNYRQQKLLEV